MALRPDAFHMDKVHTHDTLGTKYSTLQLSEQWNWTHSCRTLRACLRSDVSPDISALNAGLNRTYL